MRGKRRGKRVVQLKEVGCVEASKTESIVINKTHPWDGRVGEKESCWVTTSQRARNKAKGIL